MCPSSPRPPGPRVIKRTTLDSRFRGNDDGSMRPFMHRESCARQRGWVGLVVILLALVIVAVLAKDALKQYGLVPGAGVETKAKAGTGGERVRAPGAVGADGIDFGSAPVAPAAVLERARGVEEMVKQQADERAARFDGATK